MKGLQELTNAATLNASTQRLQLSPSWLRLPTHPSPAFSWPGAWRTMPSTCLMQQCRSRCVFMLLLPPCCCSRAGSCRVLKATLPADLGAIGRPIPPVGLPLLPACSLRVGHAQLLTSSLPPPSSPHSDPGPPHLCSPGRGGQPARRRDVGRRAHRCAVLHRVAAVNCCRASAPGAPAPCWASMEVWSAALGLLHWPRPPSACC